MGHDKQKLAFLLNLANATHIYTPAGVKAKWTGVLGDELVSYTPNHFLSAKSTQKWIDAINNVVLPGTDPGPDPTIDDVFREAKRRRPRNARRKEKPAEEEVDNGL